MAKCSRRSSSNIYNPTDSELIASVVDAPPESDHDFDDKDDIHVQEEVTTWSEAADAFQKIVNFVKQQSCYSPHEAMQFHIMHSEFLRNVKHQLNRETSAT